MQEQDRQTYPVRLPLPGLSIQSSPPVFKKKRHFQVSVSEKIRERRIFFLRLLPLSALLLSCALVFLFSGETKASVYAFFRRSFLLNQSPMERIFIVQYKDGKKRSFPFI